MSAGIYCIKNTINDKKYIGQTVNLNDRWCKHRYALQKQIHDNYHLQCAWNKYGESVFLFSAIEECENNVATLNKKEQYWIGELHTTNPDFGYNYKPGGDTNIGYKHTDEAKAKISDTHKGKPKSEEHRKKLSQANIGKPKSEEHRKKLSDSMKRRLVK